MSTAKTYSFALLLFLFSFTPPLHAQNAESDTALYYQAVQHVVTYYTKMLEENTRLYNGTEYIEAHPGVIGSPFWKSDTLQMGNLYYDGVFYPGILLAYDVVKGEVVIKNRQRLSIKLLTEEIDSFSIANQLFVPIANDSTDNSSLPTGFYHILYNSTVIVLADRRKTAQRVLIPTDHYEFKEGDSYFVKKNGRYYAVTNKNTLLNALQDEKERVKKFMQKNKFDFKRNLETAIIKTADYYSGLNK